MNSNQWMKQDNRPKAVEQSREEERSFAHCILNNKKSGRDFEFKESWHTGDLTICLTAGPDSVWNNMCFLSFPYMDRLVGGWYWWTCMDCVGKIWWLQNYSVSISSPDWVKELKTENWRAVTNSVHYCLYFGHKKITRNLPTVPRLPKRLIGN